MRNSMHANRARQIEYLARAQAGAAAGTIPFEIARQFPIDGEPALNDFSALAAIDVDDDGVSEFLHYNGSKQIQRTTQRQRSSGK